MSTAAMDNTSRRREATLAFEIDEFLRGRGSPLAGYGQRFVEAGRRERVDPRFLVAITGAESSFGKEVKAGTFNPFGWGPHIPFSSWGESIDTVAHGLRAGYLEKGLTTIAAIARKWAPAGAANDPTGLNSNWVRNVSTYYRELGGNTITTGSTAPAPAPQLGDYVTTDGDADLSRVNPNLLARLWLLGAHLGKTIVATSGYRSDEYQTTLYDEWLAGKRAGPVAKPEARGGKGSNHSRGQAVDATIGGRAIADVVDASTLEQFGLRSLKSIGDPVHVEEITPSEYKPGEAQLAGVFVPALVAVLAGLAPTLGPKVAARLRALLGRGRTAAGRTAGATGKLAGLGALGVLLSQLGVADSLSLKWAALWLLLTLAGLVLILLGVLRLAGIRTGTAIAVARGGEV